MSSEGISVLGFFGTIVILTSLWVSVDSWRNKVTSAGNERWYGTEPFTWLLACLFVWIVAFPWYLVRRSKIIQQNT